MFHSWIIRRIIVSVVVYDVVVVLIIKLRLFRGLRSAANTDCLRLFTAWWWMV